MKLIYGQVLEMARKMLSKGFYIKDLDYTELEDNGCVFENDVYYLMVYFKPEMKIKCYPNVTYESEWQDYYDSYMDVVVQISHIEKCWKILYSMLKKMFPNFKIIQFNGCEYNPTKK